MAIIENINYAFDLQIDLYIKSILLGLLLIFSIYGIWFSKIEENNKYHEVFFKFFFVKIPSIVYVYFLPFFTVFLYRGVKAEELLIYIGSFYGFYMVGLFIFSLIWGTQYMLQMFGIETPNFKKMRRMGGLSLRK